MLFESLIAPVLMAVADGVILAWVLVEIRNAGLGDVANESMDLEGWIALLPGTMLVCFLAMPARYVSGAVALVLPYFPGMGLAPVAARTPPSGIWLDLLVYIRWQLGEGLIVLQALALAALPLVGAAAWSNGRFVAVLRGAGDLLRNEGGRLFSAILACGLACFGLAAIAYIPVLAIPTQTWILTAADAYAHYATLPIGLILTAMLIEMSRRTLPHARPIESIKPVAEVSPSSSEPVAVVSS